MSEIVLKRNLQLDEVVYYSAGYSYSSHNSKWDDNTPKFKMSPVKLKEPRIFKLYFKWFDGDKVWFNQSDEQGNKIELKKKFYNISEISKMGLLSRDINEVKATLALQVTEKRLEAIQEIQVMIGELDKQKAKIQAELDEITLMNLSKV